MIEVRKKSPQGAADDSQNRKPCLRETQKSVAISELGWIISHHGPHKNYCCLLTIIYEFKHRSASDQLGRRSGEGRITPAKTRRPTPARPSTDTPPETSPPAARSPRPPPAPRRDKPRRAPAAGAA